MGQIKKVLPKVEMTETCLELMNPHGRIYAFVSNAIGKHIYFLNHTPLSRDYDDDSAIWSWSSFSPFGGSFGIHKTMEDAVNEAFKHRIEILEFETVFDFLSWAFVEKQQS